MSTLCMSQCDPPFEKSWLRPCESVRQRPVRQHMKSIRQRRMSVRQRG